MPRNINATYTKPDNVHINLDSETTQSQVLLNAKIKRVSNPEQSTRNQFSCSSLLLGALGIGSLITTGLISYAAGRSSAIACIPGEESNNVTMWGNGGYGNNTLPYNDSLSSFEHLPEALQQMENDCQIERCHFRHFTFQEIRRYQQKNKEKTDKGTWTFQTAPNTIPKAKDVEIMSLKRKDGKIKIDYTPFETAINQLSFKIYPHYLQLQQGNCLNYKQANTIAQQLDAVVEAYVTQFNLPDRNMQLFAEELSQQINSCNLHTMEIINRYTPLNNNDKSKNIMKYMSEDDKRYFNQLKSIHKTLNKVMDRIPKKYHPEKSCTTNEPTTSNSQKIPKVDDIKIETTKSADGKSTFFSPTAYSNVVEPLMDEIEFYSDECLNTQNIKHSTQVLDVTVQAYLQHNLPDQILSDFSENLFQIKEDISMHMMKLRTENLKNPLNFGKNPAPKKAPSYADLKAAHTQIQNTLNRIPKRFHPKYFSCAE